MAGFTPVRDSHVESDLELPISSLTLAIGDMIELDVGATTWTVADASTEHWQKKAVCSESATTADSVVKARLVSHGTLYEVETANNTSTDDNGDRMLLTDQNTVNNTGTDNTSEEAIFIQYQPKGAASDQLALGWFVQGEGVNPDAA